MKPSQLTLAYRALDCAHDKLSAILEDPETTEGQVREAATTVCLRLNRLHEVRTSNEPALRELAARGFKDPKRVLKVLKAAGLRVLED